MQNIKKFTYEVRTYDALNRTIDVFFTDTEWARVAFRGIMPTTLEELDRVVAPFAPHVEHLQAAGDDDTFVRSVVGLTREAARFSEAATPPPADALPEEALNSLAESEEAWVEAVIRRVLVTEGLIKEPRA